MRRYALFGALCALPFLAAASPAPTAYPPALPAAWSVYAGNPEHAAVFKAPSTVWGRALQRGVSWRFAEANAIPLSTPYGKDVSALGKRGAPVKTTQFLGNAVGVSVLGGTLYAESDSDYIYALDAVTGRLRWRTAVDNAAMGDPIVAANRVFVGVGDTGFSFSQVLKAQGGKKSGLVRGLSWSAVYALDAATGQKLWRYATHGEDMPSQCYDAGTVFFGNGDGHVYALNAANGKPRWITATGGFDSMSSCTIYHGIVIAGFTDPNDLVAVNQRSGKIVWRTAFPHVANTGMGDNSPTIDPQHNEVIQVAASDARSGSPSATVDTTVLGIDAATGRINWRTRLGRGPTPPAYKAGVAMVHNGVVYVSSPVTSKLYALDSATGRIRWSSAIPHAYAPGLGRGASAYLDGALYQTTGSYIYKWNASNGRLVHAASIGGRFGITNPVIVGRTLFASNSWGWIMAIPLASI